MIRVEYGSFFKHLDQFINSDCHSCRAGRVYTHLGMTLASFIMLLFIAAMVSKYSIVTISTIALLGAVLGYRTKQTLTQSKLAILESETIRLKKEIAQAHTLMAAANKPSSSANAATDRLQSDLI